MISNANFWLQILIYFFQAFIISFSKNPIYLGFFLIIYHLLHPQIIKTWYNSTRRILMFYIAYLIFAMVMQIPFERYIFFIIKIQLLVMLSTGLFNTIKISNFLHDTSFMKRNKYGINVQRLVISLSLLLPRFFKQFSQIKKDKSVMDSVLSTIAREEAKLPELSYEVENIRLGLLPPRYSQIMSDFFIILWIGLSVMMEIFLRFRFFQ